MPFPIEVLTVLLSTYCAVNAEFYDSFTGKEINRTRYEEMNRLGLVPFCAIEVPACDKYGPRRMDGGCNNWHYPSRGTTLTPYRRLLPPVFGPGGTLRSSKSGKPLPLARPLRVATMSDGRRPSDKFTHMVTNYNVLITGDITSVHDTVNYVAVTRTCCQPGGDQDPRCMPVEVKDDDVHLRRSNVRCMNLTRAITYQRLGCIGDDIQPERINTATPLLDLSVVYGNDLAGARKGREYKGGRLKAEILNGKEWPPNGGVVCLNNVPPLETRCHDSPMAGANSVLGLNLVFLWFYRNHNIIADFLHKLNPCWDDNKLYYTAREINIAYYNQILYYEMLPELLGWDFLVQNKVVYPTIGHVDDYDSRLEPTVSIEYVVATRWFHSIQEGVLNLYKSDGRLYGSVAVVDYILRTGALPINGTIEGMTQGSFRQPGAATDDVVDPDISERILGRLQFASDVVSSDIMKSRDVGLPPYNQYRKVCGLTQAKKFKDLLGWMERKQVEVLATHYEHPDDIDVMTAMLAEKPMPGASVGPTLACIMAEQLRYFRRSDRFWYENKEHPGAFTEEQLHEIRKMTLAKLLCVNGDGVIAVQPNAFLIPRHGNEITDCRNYEYPYLSVFEDNNRCYPNYNQQFNPTLDSNSNKYSDPKIYIENSKTSPYLPMTIFGQNNLGLSHTDPKKILNLNPYSNIEFSNIPKLLKTNLDINKNDPKYNEYKNRGYSDPKLDSILYPNPDPKVSIYPNSNPTESEILKKSQISPNIVSIPNYSDSKRNLGQDYHNLFV